MGIRYYAVDAKCGHVGINNYIIVKFAVAANSGKEAALKTRFFPRVKHHQKDAIINVKEINYVDNCIVFNNNFVLKGITKKIDF